MVAAAAGLLTAFKSESALAWCDAPYSETCPTGTPLAAPASAPSQCPTAGPNACLNFSAPLHCVVGSLSIGGNPASCVFNYTTIQDAIDHAGAFQTISVAPPLTPGPRIESLVINQYPVCLRTWNNGFWGEPPLEKTHPVTIQNPPASPCNHPNSCQTILIGRFGSGSCIQGFHVDFRGEGTGAVRIGYSATGSHANDVTLVNNRIDVSNSGNNGPNAEQPHGITIAGRDNHIYRNAIVGKQDVASRGVNLRWLPADDSTCADWDGNEINDNSVSSFEDGVHVFSGGLVACPTWSGNRVDRNEISQCNSGIFIGAGVGAPIRLAVMENHIGGGRPYTNFAACAPESQQSNGIRIGDVDNSDVSGNRIAGVGIGIHIAYGACFSRFTNNQVFATKLSSITTLHASGIWVCPSHCNALVDNELATNDDGLGVGINFANLFENCPSAKPQGRHSISGGRIGDAFCLTKGATTSQVDIGVLPGRGKYNTVACP